MLPVLLVPRLIPAAAAEGPAYLVKDIYPGTSSSGPYSPRDVNGNLLFVAIDADHGSEVWKSDGSASGTSMVKEIWQGPGGAFGGISGGPPNLVNVSGTVYFAAADLSHGGELWRTDGTESGTLLVKDIYPGSGASYERLS